MKTAFLGFLFFLISPLIAAQNQEFSRGQGAQEMGGGCYLLTPAQYSRHGIIWHKDQINLKESFDLEFLANFGNRDQDGGDGILFALQTSGSGLSLQNGTTLGFSSLGSGLGIEFDTYRNVQNQGGPFQDPEFDHIAVISGGTPFNPTDRLLVEPVQAHASSPNIEDGKDHLIRIVWKPVQQELTVFFDCQQRVLLHRNILEDVPGGGGNAWWGLSSTTGSVFNDQKVCFPQQPMLNTNYSVCIGQSVTLASRLSPVNHYRWAPAEGLDNPAIQNPRASPTQSTTYTVTYQNYCGLQVTDTVKVTVITNQTILGKDTTLCKGSVLLLAPNLVNGTYRWQDGSTQPVFQISKAGTYWVTVNNIRCQLSDTIRVAYQPRPSFNLGKDTTFCQGSTLLVQPLTGGDLSIRWEDGSTQPFRAIQKGGYYWAIGSQNGCSVIDTLKATEKPFFPVDLGMDRTICEGEVISLAVPTQISAQATFQWSTGSRHDTVLVNQPVTIWLESNLDGCLYRDSVTIHRGECEGVRFAIPDAFTPNQDGQNDLLPVFYSGIEGFELSIYNRWGEVIYESRPGKMEWNGEGHPLGVYPWVVTYQYLDTVQRRHSIRKSGQVVLLR